MSASIAASLCRRLLLASAISCSLVSVAMGQLSNAADVEATTSLLGSYMAGRLGRSHHDSTTAVAFYRRALDRDPLDPQVVESSFLVEAAEGNFAEATALARKVVANQPGHRLAHMWLA